MGRRLAQALQLGDVHGVLEDAGDFAAFIVDRRVRRAPETILDPAVAIRGPGHSIPDESDHVRLAGRENALERLPEQRGTLVARIRRVVGKLVEQVPADELFQPLAGDLQVRVVRSHEPQLPVEHHVRIRRVLKESPEVDSGRHALGSSLPVASCQFPVTSEGQVSTGNWKLATGALTIAFTNASPRSSALRAPTP